MNPIVTIFGAASLIMGVGLMATTDPETDTWGLVSATTAYSPVVADTLPTTTEARQAQYKGPGCAQWADTAIRGGFTFDDLRTALQVMELESMCLPDSIGDDGQSYGLMQINSYWCLPNKYWPRGYLQTQGIANSCADLLDPLTNLWAAWKISSNYGWENWTTYKRIDG